MESGLSHPVASQSMKDPLISEGSERNNPSRYLCPKSLFIADVNSLEPREDDMDTPLKKRRHNYRESLFQVFR
jgi:hypothetical protein